MTSEELGKYYIPAIKMVVPSYNSYATVADAEELDRLLGTSIYQEWVANRPGRHPLPEELKQLYIKLSGPHGRTVLKAWRILKGLDR